MATINYTRATVFGVAYATAAASAGGDKVKPNPFGAVIINNGGGASITVTIATPGNDKYNQARPDITVTIPAGTAKVIGPLPDDLADPADGLVAITYSATTSVTIGAIVLN